MSRRQRLIERMDELGLTQESLAHAVDSHPKSVGRWVRGFSTPGAAKRQALARELRWSTADVHRAFSDGEPAAPNGHAVPAHLTHFTSLEAGAAEMRSWAPLMFPALLQAPGYAAAAERAVTGGALTEAEIAERVAFRLARQRAILREAEPLRLYALLDASVLLRAEGGPDVMAGQVDHLRAMAERANVEVRVVPLDGRAFTAPGAFHLLSRESGAPYIACPSDLMGIQYVENPPSLVDAYADLFALLWESADALEEVDLLR
ncbi:MAG TPA: Scr1 family TA system antitoxin-like transcriptional regulator [Acidimicrobiales bacterium]|nr:Scr1 family TA system antitoxin-like transcriptional regulator [Acidimicrobiales bacterium]